MLVLRFSEDGQSIERFSGDAPGTANPNFNGVISFGIAESFGLDVAIQTDGKIVVGGTATNTAGNGRDFAFARFLPNGTLDSSFGNAGKTFVSFPNNATLIRDDLRAIAIDNLGRIVAVGSAQSDGSVYGAVAIARLLSDAHAMIRLAPMAVRPYRLVITSNGQQTLSFCLTTATWCPVVMALPR